MSGTTDQVDMQWNYEVRGAFESPATMPEPGSLQDVATELAKLQDYSAQAAELDEMLRKNDSTSTLPSLSLGGGDSHILFEAILRLGKPSNFGSGALPAGTPDFSAGCPMIIHPEQDYGRAPAVSVPIAWDHETPLLDGQVQECARWPQPTGGCEEPFPVVMDSRSVDGNSDASRAFQSQRNLDDQSPPQPPSARLTINAPLSPTPTPVSSPLSSSGLTPSSRNPARNRIHQCPHPGCTLMFDRTSRAQACFNKHQKEKPHRCQGGCGNNKCDMSFISKDRLRSHTAAPCPHCLKPFTKGNIAEYRKRCSSRSASAVPGLSRTTGSSTRNRRTPTPGAALQASQAAENES